MPALHCIQNKHTHTHAHTHMHAVTFAYNKEVLKLKLVSSESINHFSVIAFLYYPKAHWVDEMKIKEFLTLKLLW